MYQKYVEQGFEILHFPCNQFGRQAKGSSKEIKKFCSSNFGTTFSQFGKIDVNGENADPLYTWLKSQKGFAGFDLNNQIGAALDAKFRSEDPNYAANPDIKWNFTKFLLDRNGEVQERFESTAAAGEMAPTIEALL